MDQISSPYLPVNSYRTLGRKTLWLFFLERSSFGILLLVISIAVLISSGPPEVHRLLSYLPFAVDLGAISVLGFIVALGFLAVAFLIAYLTYRNYRFLLDTDSLKIKRGIFSQEEISIPYRQIQDVDIYRPFSLRLLGLSVIIILTAGQEKAGETGESEGLLPAMDNSEVEEIRNELLRRAEVQRVAAEPEEPPPAPIQPQAERKVTNN